MTIEDYRNQITFELEQFLASLRRLQLWAFMPWYSTLIYFAVILESCLNKWPSWMDGILLVLQLGFIQFCKHKTTQWSDNALLHSHRYQKIMMEPPHDFDPD